VEERLPCVLFKARLYLAFRFELVQEKSHSLFLFLLITAVAYEILSCIDFESELHKINKSFGFISFSGHLMQTIACFIDLAFLFSTDKGEVANLIEAPHFFPDCFPFLCLLFYLFFHALYNLLQFDFGLFIFFCTFRTL
jgi:hypothetical protein